jgi:6-phosphofructokinase 1
VIVVAEGAGQDILGESSEKDASGNVKLKDIGLYLKQEILAAAAGWGEDVSVRYFDPSYLIRSVPATGDDSIFCADLARAAAHAGMAGKTAMFVGYWHGVFTHVPLAAVAGKRRKIDPQSSLWQAVLSTTGQPPVLA